MSDSALTQQLDELEAAAKGLLEKVKAPSLRAKLDLAVRDIEEARRWLVSPERNEQVAHAAAGFAAGRIRDVQEVVSRVGFDPEEIG